MHEKVERVFSGQEKAEQLQRELNQIKEAAIASGKLVYDGEGKFKNALAPNGEKSQLNEKQWLETRTTFFRDWFGDWEANPQNASKLLDSNGEPLVFYHGTTRKFDSFSHEVPKTFDLDNVKGAFFLTSDRKFAENEYGKFKHNLILDTLREFNKQFFDGKASEWSVLIDKWNEFIKSIGSERVNFQKPISDGAGGFRGWTISEFDNKPIFSSDELGKLWDGNFPA